jgi:hypothetical protein
MLLLGLVVSLLLHAGVLVPALIGVMTADPTNPPSSSASTNPPNPR